MLCVCASFPSSSPCLHKRVERLKCHTWATLSPTQTPLQTPLSCWEHTHICVRGRPPLPQTPPRSLEGAYSTWLVGFVKVEATAVALFFPRRRRIITSQTHTESGSRTWRGVLTHTHDVGVGTVAIHPAPQPTPGSAESPRIPNYCPDPTSTSGYLQKWNSGRSLMKWK